MKKVMFGLVGLVIGIAVARFAFAPHAGYRAPVNEDGHPDLNGTW